MKENEPRLDSNLQLKRKRSEEAFENSSKERHIEGDPGNKEIENSKEDPFDEEKFIEKLIKDLK